jgi:adenylate cyclase
MGKRVQSGGSDRRKYLKSNALICLGVALIFVFIKAGEQELALGDLVTKNRSRAEVDSRMVLVGIDDTSLKVLDMLDEEIVLASPELDLMSFGYPFPRSVYAALVRKLLGAGARLIVFDMLFLQPGEKADEDAELKAVLEEFGDRVVIGAGYVRAATTEASAASGQDRMGLPDEAVLDWKGTDDRRVGFVNFFADADNVVREAVAAMRIYPNPDSPLYHSLALAALKQLGEEGKWKDPQVPRKFKYPRFLPKKGEKDFEAPYEPIPFYTLFVDQDWEKNYGSGERFKDKIVFVGGTSDAQFHDVFNAPHGVMLGAQLQMTVLAAALHGDFYHAAETPWMVIACIFIMAMAAMVAASRVRHPVLGLTIILGLAGTYFFAARGVYFGSDFLLPLFGPIWTLVSAGVLCLVYQFAVSQVEKARLRRTLERQVSKELAAHILNQPEDYYNSLPGVRKPVTILFSDIRGFTTRSEKDDPVQLVKQLKEYLDAMCKVVFNHGGVVDKFIGDAVMAVWGNIKSEGSEQDARNAVAAAVEMQDRLDTLNAKWASDGIDPYAIGIGLNHGEVIFGLMGSEEKQEMTVIGDPVNQAARLESLTKKFGEGIVIGEKVADFLGDRFKLRCIGAIRTKGKTEAAKLYGVRGSVSAEDEDWMRRYHTGLEAFEKGDVPAAGEIFKVCAEEKPDDLVCHMYLDVIESGETEGGALTMREK